MARGGNPNSNLKVSVETGDVHTPNWHVMLTEIAKTSDRFLHPDHPAPGVTDPAAEAAAALIESMDPAELRAKLAQGLVIDMDDTLNTNVPLYHQSRWLMMPLYAEASGRDDLMELMLEREAVCQRLLPEYGYTPERWRRACMTYLDEIAPDAPQDLRDRLEAACEVALGTGEFYGGVERTLAALKRADVPMLLLTKGEAQKQHEKILDHNLERFFSHIQIVDHKDASVLRTAALNAGLKDPVVVGDSAASDIAPATQLGWGSVHVDRGGSTTWAAEAHDAAHSARKAPSFPEAIALLLA